jgi:serine/threonine-protein kinase
MSEERLNDLLLAWQEQRLQGRDAPPAELCRDCPELADELGKRIAVLRQMNALAEAAGPPARPGAAAGAAALRDSSEATLDESDRPAAPSLPALPGYEGLALPGLGKGNAPMNRPRGGMTPAEQARFTDRICTKFEEAWRSGRPRIEDYLPAAAPADVMAVLRELILLDVEYRRRAGDNPSAADYRARFATLDSAWLGEALGPPDTSNGAGWPSRGGTGAGALPTVPGYEVLAELGRGGMAVVYLARQVSLGRLVALKMILHGPHAGPVELARFRAEALAVARLSHPNIVQIHEVGLHDGRPFLSLEHVEGGSLDKKSSPLPPPSAAELTQRLARAIHYAHQQGIVHRDLKPANVLLTADGTPKISDFGLVKFVPGQPAGPAPAPATVSGAILGTPSYMAPEQAAGRSHAVGPAADVYALGAILYELLTGRPPFLGQDYLETLQQVYSADPLPPSRWQPRVPRDLDTICLKCLEKTPLRRYASAAELALDLARYLAGEPIQARPVGWGERLLKWSRRRPAAAALVGFSLAAVLLLAGAWSWQARAGAQRRVQTARRVEQALDRVASLRGRAAAEPGQGRAAWSTARAEARGAEAMLEQGEGNDDLLQRVRDVLGQLDAEERDRRMVERLEELRMPTEILEGAVDWPRIDADHRAAFRDYGIDVERLTTTEAADLIRARAISEHLKVALLTWARRRSAALPNDPAGWQRLVEVARQAETDPLWQRMLDALLRKDLPTLQALSANPQIGHWSASTLLLVGSGLAFLGDSPAGLKLLRQAQREHPGDFWLTHTLAFYLYQKEPPELTEAIRLFTAAVALRPGSAAVRNSFGKALAKQGKLDDAILAYRQAIRLNPRFAEPHANLGNAWRMKGRLDDAGAEYLKAIDLQKDYVPAYVGLGHVRQQEGKTDEAAALYRRAIERRKDYMLAHFNLAEVLRKQSKLDEAIPEYRQAIALRKDYAPAYKNLGIALWKQGRLDEAIAAHEIALHLRPGYAEACNNLANVLVDKSQLDRAIALYGQALRLKKGYAEAHCNLGRALQSKGQLVEALTALKRGHELGSKQPNWARPSEQWVRACEGLLALEARLPDLLRGTVQPGSAAERLDLAQLCRLKHRHGAAARFYHEAFAAQPALAESLSAGHRYQAACAAVLAGCGQGIDAAATASPPASHWRQEALAWLRADLACWSRELAGTEPTRRWAAQQTLARWHAASDLKGVRDPTALARLPAEEQKAWREFWADVAALREQSRPR